MISKFSTCVFIFFLYSCSVKSFKSKNLIVAGTYLGYWKCERKGTNMYFLKKYIFIDSLTGRNCRVANIYPMGRLIASCSINGDIAKEAIFKDTLPNFRNSAKSNFKFQSSLFKVGNDSNYLCIAFKIKGEARILKCNLNKFLKEDISFGKGDFCESEILDPLILFFQSSKDNLSAEELSKLNLTSIIKNDIIYSTCH